MKKDRAYLLQGGQEITIAGTVVECLISLNQKHREDKSKDRTFIKGLLLSTFTLKAIENLAENQLPPKEVLAFIKDLFIIRIGEHDDAKGSRYLDFQNIIDLSVKEIRIKNYK